MRALGHILVLVVAAISLLPARAETAKERHLEIVKWDVNTQKLVAVVSEGHVIPAVHEKQTDGTTATTPEKYVPERLIDYEIDLQAGTITCAGESENFSRYEGELMWRVVDMVVNYTGESVLWFESTHEGKPKESAAIRKGGK